MGSIIPDKILYLFLTAMLLSVMVPSMVQKSYGDPLDVLHASLPGEIDGWKAIPGGDRSYDSESIFEYINGEGEVYRAYNMEICLSRRYTIPNGPPIVLDIFDMGSSIDAFGVFTHDQDGEALLMGQGGLYRYGWLRFWKDRFFVSVYTEEETQVTKKVVIELGNLVASLITSQGPKPDILLKLPPDGLQERSARYLHHHDVLNYHFYLSDENILSLGSQTDAVLAEYRIGEQSARLLIVMYPNEIKAAKAFDRFIAHYIPDADSSGVALLEDGKWSAAAVKDRLLTIVLESDTRHLAQDLLKKIMEG